MNKKKRNYLKNIGKMKSRGKLVKVRILMVGLIISKLLLYYFIIYFFLSTENKDKTI